MMIKKILFVTNNTSVFFLRFQSHQQPFNNFKEHFQNPVEFIGNSKLKKNILFRNYKTSNDSSFKIQKELKKSIQIWHLIIIITSTTHSNFLKLLF